MPALLIALATHLLVAHAGEATVILSDEKGKCEEGWARALWVEPKGTVEGCWLERQKVVWVQWDDGDKSAIAREMFHEVKES